MAGFRYPQRSLESLDGALIVAKLRVQHPDIVQHPGDRLVVARTLEFAEAAGVARFGGDEVSAHVEEHAAVLFDHSQ